MFFGVNVLWDLKSIVVFVVGCGVMFCCEIFIGVYVSDMGYWELDVG